MAHKILNLKHITGAGGAFAHTTPPTSLGLNCNLGMNLLFVGTNIFLAVCLFFAMVDKQDWND